MVTRQERWKRAALVLGSLFLALAVIELVLRVMQLATDVARYEGDPVLGFKLMPNQTGTYVIGQFGEEKTRFRINSDGWNAIRNYNEKRDQAIIRIAVIGDSYVEAINVPSVASVAAVLERTLLRAAKVEVYSFGISGASLSHYLAMMRYVRSRFSPDLYIFNIVHNDFYESLTIEDRAIFHSVRRAGESYEEVPPKIYRRSLFRGLIAYSAVARYFAVHLNINSVIGQIYELWRPRQHGRFEANIDTAKMDLGQMRDVVNYLFKKYLQEVDNDRRRIVLVFDSPRQPIYEGIHPRTTRAFQYNQLAAEVCRDLSLYCRDLSDLFWSDFQQNKRRFNSEIDSHWNEYGHKIAAKAIETFLLKNFLLSTRLVIMDCHFGSATIEQTGSPNAC